MTFRKVMPDEIDLAFEIYRMNIGAVGNTWDEDYPSREFVENDVAAGNLYCLYDKGIISVGALEVDSLGEVEWGDFPRLCDISRIGVHPDFKGQGYGEKIVRMLINTAKAEGFSHTCLLVSPGNFTAIGLYEKLGFRELGECFAYGEDWKKFLLNLTEFQGE